MHPPSLIDIATRTPPWVWLLLAALIALGLSQARSRQMTVRRVTVLPLALLALSLAGVVTAFGADGGTLAAALAAYACGLAAALTLGRAVMAPAGAHWLPGAARVQVPGSGWPLVLIVGLFCIKYAVGVGLAIHPQWAVSAAFATPAALCYGVFSGLFGARALALRQVARQGALHGARHGDLATIAR